MSMILLETLASTHAFAKLFGELLFTVCDVRCVLLSGKMGSGKTELTRSIVNSLPGGTEAMVASPTFSICNHYQTIPPVLHCDLYRCKSAIPDELIDILEDKSELAIIEWADFLPSGLIPPEALDIRLKACNKKRLLTIVAHGILAEKLGQNLLTTWLKRL